ncbi:MULTISPECIES: cytochrome c biogenesis protein ResB [unclassified Isoptericola]|uniref:cytochrome c biogenesis protein ResB n=1 Tax=unclassified Isoptericola TaxID=2623355 RepID=UPI0027142722|nr:MULTISPECIES: cytochrome c biogenesis protein ResB [unclassified Isoptericola]MDO8143254.1 cytochrome c biogenesis protein ResB [Isoptericola sp. 178]MDO8147115.1 cytochrome c biogenesis protein ResB [Isoptericola sp. b515]
MSERTYRPEGIADDFTTGEPTSAADARPEPSGAPSSPRGPQAPQLGWRGMLRWTWRQLTSMRVALMLLMLLAVAALPGSILPQRDQDPAAVVEYLGDHPTAGEWLDRFGFFDVYTSVWFSAIYLLLLVSLVGCIVPRTIAHARALRARPPRTPARFERFPVHVTGTTSATPDEVADAASTHLRGRWRRLPTFRVETGAEDARAARGALPGRPAARTVAAERGYLRESGNLLFHLALVGLVIAVAVGQLMHYRGQAIITEGRGFANAVVDYDTFESGAWFAPESLVPFSMTLDSFESEFATDTVAFAQSRDFTADVTVTEPDGSSRAETIRVNHPLEVDGSKIYLQGNGYAPEITVTDAEGATAFSGRVPFLPEDQVYTSRGVVKVPDVSPGLDQIGLIGYFLPTAVINEDGTAESVFPLPEDPLLVLEVYRGDLGLDAGVPQNVYRLDTANLTPSLDDDGGRVTLLLEPGDSVELPDGLGTVALGEDVPRFVALDLRHDPSLAWVLTFALLALLGLTGSLFLPRRRVWVRSWTSGGVTRVEVAGLARGDDAGLETEVDKAFGALPDVERDGPDGAGRTGGSGAGTTDGRATGSEED